MNINLNSNFALAMHNKVIAMSDKSMDKLIKRWQERTCYDIVPTIDELIEQLMLDNISKLEN